MPGVFVGPSIWRQINVRTMSAMMAAIVNNPSGEHLIWAPIWNDALIGRSRSIMCTEFLKTECDVMVIIDDDIVFEWEDFWKIVEGARDTRGIYGGAYVTRSTTPHISSRAIPGSGEQVFAAGPVRRPHEYQYLATGFFAIHRDVLESMKGQEFTDAYGTHRMEEVALGADRPFVPFFSPFTCREEDGRLHYLSEDWAFCNRARQAGARVWVDLSIILQHMGEYPYTVKDLETLKEPGLPSTGIDTMQVEGASFQKTGDPILDDVVADIAAFTEDDPGDVRRMLPGSNENLAKLWLSRKECEEDWYRREDVGYLYLTDLAHWHERGLGVLPSTWIEAQDGKAVLDFGAGNGQLSQRLAMAGARVDAVETNPVMREFIQFRHAKYGGALEAFDAIPERQYDVVVAWHVFEHLERPEETLDALLVCLKRDGVFITQSGFQDASTPQHHVRADWDDVLRDRGLVGDMSWPDSDGHPWVFRKQEALVAV